MALHAEKYLCWASARCGFVIVCCGICKHGLLPVETSMITEIAQIDVKPGTEAEFEAAVQAAPIFKRSKGCHGMELRRSIEKPSRYRLLVNWETLEDPHGRFPQLARFPGMAQAGRPLFRLAARGRARAAGRARVLARPPCTGAAAAFLRPRLGPYWVHGEKPRPTARAERARSGQAFEKRPGQADPLQGGAAGRAGARSDVGGFAQSRRSVKAAPASARRPDRARSSRGSATRAAAPSSPRKTSRPHPYPSPKGEGSKGERPSKPPDRTTARQFLRPPRRFCQRAPRARVGRARLRRGAAAGLCRQDPGAARRTRSRPRPCARHRRGGSQRPKSISATSLRPTWVRRACA